MHHQRCIVMSGDRAKVLLVEDESLVAMLVEDLLDLLGYAGHQFARRDVLSDRRQTSGTWDTVCFCEPGAHLRLRLYERGIPTPDHDKRSTPQPPNTHEAPT